MPRSSGTYSLPAGNPVITGTTISITWANSTLTDIGTELTNSLPRDGTAPPTANIPMGNFKFTGLAAGTTAGNSLRYEQVVGVYLPLAGGTVTGATTFSADITVPDEAYNATNWNGNLEVPTKNALRDKIETLFVLGTSQASTSGTSIDFTSIPSGTKSIVISCSGLSLSGTANLIVQLGDSGGVETNGYLGSGSTVTGVTTTSSNFTAGFGLNLSSASLIIHGSITLTLIDSSTNTWAASGVLGRSDAASNSSTAGSKALSATLDRVRITTSNGTDTFDAGLINIYYMG